MQIHAFVVCMLLKVDTGHRHLGRTTFFNLSIRLLCLINKYFINILKDHSNVFQFKQFQAGLGLIKSGIDLKRAKLRNKGKTIDKESAYEKRGFFSGRTTKVVVPPPQDLSGSYFFRQFFPLMKNKLSKWSEL